MKLHLIGLNHDYYSTGGAWGVAVRSDTKLSQLLAPVFPARYDAELFCAVYHLVGDPVGNSAEAALQLAEEIAEFHCAFDATQDGLEYPTHDGRYPSAPVLARWFAEARERKGEVLPWAA